MKQRLGKIVHQMTLFDSKVPVGIKPLLTAKMIPLQQIRQAFVSRDFLKGGVVLVHSFHSRALVISGPVATLVTGLKKLFSAEKLMHSSGARTSKLGSDHTSSITAFGFQNRPVVGLRGFVLKVQILFAHMLQRFQGILLKLFPRFFAPFGERARTGGQGGRDRGAILRERMRKAYWSRHLHKINKKRVRKTNKKQTQHILKLPNDTWEPLD